MTIFEKMLKATAEIGVVAKKLNVQTGRNGSYKAVSERDVLDAVKPIEEKYGIYSYPVSREIVESERLETKTVDSVKTVFYCHIKTVYRFVNVEDAKDYIDITSFAVGLDSGDKGDGKAMTYADKYALMKAYKISTGDDPDKDASVDTHYTRYASTAQKKTLMATASKLGVNINDVLKQTGFIEGKLTEDQYDKAVIVLKEIEEAREEK